MHANKSKDTIRKKKKLIPLCAWKGCGRNTNLIKKNKKNTYLYFDSTWHFYLTCNVNLMWCFILCSWFVWKKVLKMPIKHSAAVKLKYVGFKVLAQIRIQKCIYQQTIATCINKTPNWETFLDISLVKGVRQHVCETACLWNWPRFPCKSEAFHHQSRSVITLLCVCGWTERLLALVAAAIIAARPDSFLWQVRPESGLLFGPIWSSHISLMEMAAFASCCGDLQSFTSTPKSTLPTLKHLSCYAPQDDGP